MNQSVAPENLNKKNGRIGPVRIGASTGGDPARLNPEGAEASDGNEHASVLESTASSVPQPANTSAGFDCPYPGCEYSSSTARGRGQHLSRRHKEWRDEQLASSTQSGSQSGSVWTKAEKLKFAEVVASLEGKQKPPGFRLLDEWYKAELGTNRTVEALKAQRNKNTEFKTMLADAKQRLAAKVSDTPSTCVLSDSVSQSGSREKTGPAESTSDNATPAAITSGPLGRDDSHTAGSCEEERDYLYLLRQSFMEDFGPRNSVVAPIVAAFRGMGANDKPSDDLRRLVGDSFDGWVGTLVKSTKPGPSRLNTKATDKQELKNVESVSQTGDYPARKPRSKRRKPSGRRKQLSRAETRAKLRWQAKSAFRADPYKAGKRVLDGEFESAPQDSVKATPPGLPELEAHWGEVFETASHSFRQPQLQQRPVHWELLRPVTLLEVEVGLKQASLRSAPGPDRVSYGHLRKAEPQELVDWMNAILLTRCPPETLLSGLVTMIPKKRNPSAPSDYRPITVTSTFLRLLHSILARRWDVSLPFPAEQRGFRSGIDGCMDNVTIIRNLVKHCRGRGKRLLLTFVDIRNAFGAASQEAVLFAARSMGVPEPMVDYLSEIYRGFNVRFKSGSSRQWRVNSGVLQGDPLSAVAFNCLMAHVMSNLSHDVGLPVPGDDSGKTLSYVSYADDTVMISDTRLGMERLFAELKAALAACGLVLNPLKCGTYELDADRKLKKAFLRKETFLRVDDVEIPAIGTDTECYRYLGARFSPEGIDGYCSLKTLSAGLALISRARVDPQDRLFILKNVMIPRVNFALTIGEASGKVLRAMDVLIRSEVRRWLHLPHDTPKACFHAKVRDGGLGVPSLTNDIPRLRAERLSRTLDQQLPILTGLASSDPQIAASLSKVSDRERLIDKHGSYRNKEECSDYWRKLLVKSIDGRGLSIARECPSSSEWVSRPNCGITGKEFVKAIHMRFNLLRTPARAGRGGRGRMKCLACRDSICGLGHLLQTCPTTHGYRIDRHNAVAKLVDSFIRRACPTIQGVVEPIISSTGIGLTKAESGSLKPDLMYFHRGCVTVLDPTVVADNCTSAGLRDQAFGKVHKYSKDQIKRFARSRFAITDESFDFKVIGLPVTWRGLFLSGSINAIVERFGCSSYLRVLLPIRTLVFGWRIWSAFAQKKTGRGLRFQRGFRGRSRTLKEGAHAQ